MGDVDGDIAADAGLVNAADGGAKLVGHPGGVGGGFDDPDEGDVLEGKIGGGGAFGDIEEERQGERDTGGAGDQERTGETGEVGVGTAIGPRDESEVFW